jgi:hypothetical protein
MEEANTGKQKRGKKCCQNFIRENPKGNDYFGELGVERRIILLVK